MVGEFLLEKWYCLGNFKNQSPGVYLNGVRIELFLKKYSGYCEFGEASIENFTKCMFKT